MVSDYDAGAAKYDGDPYPNETQREWVERLLATCPAGGTVLDAPCGTGRYFSMVADAGLHVVGIDQSAGMLDQARGRGIAIELEHVGLQELAYVAQFDAAMTVDAMENVPPSRKRTRRVSTRRTPRSRPPAPRPCVARSSKATSPATTSIPAANG